MEPAPKWGGRFRFHVRMGAWTMARHRRHRVTFARRFVRNLALGMVRGALGGFWPR
jgi:hypothetical protein